MDHKTKNTGDAPNGVVYTFIQKEFGRGIFPRKGACVDSENITRAFTQPNYVVKPPYIDKSTSEIEYALNDASAEDNSKYALIVIIIISHFDMIGEILTKDGSIMEKSVMEYFDGLKCPDLIETPKFFIFQISKCQKYTLTPSTSSVEADGGTETFEPIFTLPNEANILTFRSSYEGGPEFKPVDTGSYVIKTICEHMEQNGKKHIFDMMHGVLYDIKENKKMNQERGAQNNSVYTILPELCSTLTEDLYFGDEQNNRASIPIQMYEKKKKMGKVYIINYLNVWDKKKKEILGREGSEKDVKAILKCFSGLGFDPKQVTDQKKDDMITTLKEDLRDTPADKYTCIVIFFMTHGINGSLGTADLPLTEEELYSILSMEKFDGIPKAIFFQVCRGNEPSVPVPRKSVITIPNNNVLDNNESTLTSDSKASANEEENINPLSHDDFLVFHSSYSNRSSHRDEKYGSWFIQTICTEFEKLDDFVSLPKMCIKISKLVAELPVRLTKEYKAAKQMPVFRMTFTNPLTLNRFDKDLANNAPPSNYETEVTRM